MARLCPKASLSEIAPVHRNWDNLDLIEVAAHLDFSNTAAVGPADALHPNLSRKSWTLLNLLQDIKNSSHHASPRSRCGAFEILNEQLESTTLPYPRPV
jgi:hypothetical protein